MKVATHVGTVAKHVLGWSAAAALLALCVFFIADRIVLPPENARIVVDTERLTFANIPCIVLGHTDRELITNRSDALRPGADLHLQPYAKEARLRDRETGWQRDHRCNEAEGFDQIETFWNRIFGQQSRWTPDGDWRW